MVTDDGTLCVALPTKAGGMVTETLTYYSDSLSPSFPVRCRAEMYR